MMISILETKRLLIRELLPEDKDGMFLLDANPEVHRYINNRPVKTIEESIATITYVRSQYSQFGIGRWAMLAKETGDFIGWVGFKFLAGPVNGHRDFYDFGYRLRQEYWNMGYATEASLACLEYGVKTLKLSKVFAMTDVENAASRRVLEKVGFTFAGLFPYDAPPDWRRPNEPTTWYRYNANMGS